MASSINATIPIEDTDVDAPPIRANFAAAKAESEAHENHAGDVTGTHSNTHVERIRGVAVAVSPAPVAGHVLTATSAAAAHWAAPTGGGGGGPATQIHNVVISSTAPTANQVLKATSATAASWQAESGGGGGGGTELHVTVASGPTAVGQVLQSSGTTTAHWATVAGLGTSPTILREDTPYPGQPGGPPAPPDHTLLVDHTTNALMQWLAALNAWIPVG
jgi:hypothetical protein